MNVYKDLLADRFLVSLLLITAFLFILSLSLILFFYHNLPPYIPLFNQMPWGEARIAARSLIVLPIIAATCFLLVNTIISAFLYKRLPFLVRMNFFTSTFLALLSFLLVLRILFVTLL